MEISSKPIDVKLNGIELECPRCKSKILSHALFCGGCGYSVSNDDLDLSTQKLSNDSSLEGSVWNWVSPALKLWVFLLIVIGIFGLTSRLLKITSPYLDLTTQIITAIVILIICIKSKTKLKYLFINFQYFRIRSIFEMSGVLLMIYLFMSLYMKIGSLIGIEAIAILTDYKTHEWPLWAAFITICFFPGVFEELAFRGYILSKLEKIGTQKEALVIQAAMFSVLHLLPAIFLSHFVLGIILGLIRIRSRSIYPGIILHTTWNSIVIIEEYFGISSWL